MKTNTNKLTFVRKSVRNYCKFLIFKTYCGERGIRTPGPVKINGFQDRRIRPLCHLSNVECNSCSTRSGLQR